MVPLASATNRRRWMNLTNFACMIDTMVDTMVNSILS